MTGKPLLGALAVSGAVLLSGCATHTAAAAAAPHTASPFERQVRNAADAGEGDLEARQLRAKLDANPADTATRLQLADHYAKAGFPDIAVEHCRLACERAPESVDAHLALAKLLRQQEQAEEGATVLRRFAAAHGDDVEVEAWLGLLEDETGNWVAGEAAHRKAIALAPNRDDLHNNLGYCLLEQGRNADAAAEFRAALQLNPQSAVARNNLGLATAGNKTEAILNWQSVASPADAHNNMAAVLIEQGRYAEARREIDLALGYNRQHSAALNNLRLVSELDGKAAEVKLPARTGTRFSRLRAAWRHFWSGGSQAGQDGGNSGTTVASR